MQPGGAHRGNLRHRIGRQAVVRAFIGQRFVRDQRGHHERALLGHEARHALVNQVAVFDGAHAVADGAFDGVGRVGMRHHIGLAAGGFVNDDANFFFRIAEGGNRVCRRCDAARGHHLDLVRAHLEFLAHGLAHVVDAVGHAADVARAKAAAAKAHGTQVVGTRTRVAVAARLADGAARDEQARPLHRAFVDGALQAPAGAARITHGGEAPAQHGRHDGHGAHHHQRIGQHALRAQVQLRGQHMHVQVDQARHQRAAGGVDYLRRCAGDGLVRHFLDDAILDQHVVAFLQVSQQGVEQVRVLEQYGCHGISLLWLGLKTPWS
ncbi:hypothetical protein D3C72_1033720 [compost metagenome]